MDPFANGFSLICPTIKHTTESRPSRIRFIGVQERVTSCSLDSEREREGLLYPYKWVRLPPETLWRRVFPFPCSSSLLVSPFLLCREEGRMVVYPVAGLFLVALARRYRRPFQDRRLYITLIRSLSVFCRPADVLSHALGVFVNLSRLLTTAARASGRVIFCEK